MIRELKAGEIRKLLPKRDPMSHKGMNGRVLIVGGSIDFFGAPILSGLGALYGGTDLVYLMVPECNFDVARSQNPDFIVRSFPGDYLKMDGVERVMDLAKKCDAVLIGPGLGEREETMEALQKLVKELRIPTVLDAGAIQVFQQIKDVPQQQIVLTPHHNEFEALTGKDIKISGSMSGKVVLMRTLATDLKINILLKGPVDIIASEDGEVVTSSTGNAGMTVGGSGDVLSGFIAGLIAQGVGPFAACQIGAYIIGRAGDQLYKNKGYCFSASDLATELPYAIKAFL